MFITGACKGHQERVWSHANRRHAWRQSRLKKYKSFRILPSCTNTLEPKPQNLYWVIPSQIAKKKSCFPLCVQECHSSNWKKNLQASPTYLARTYSFSIVEFFCFSSLPLFLIFFKKSVFDGQRQKAKRKNLESILQKREDFFTKTAMQV